MEFRVILTIWISFLVVDGFAWTELYNLTSKRSLQRDKRFIVFLGSGVHKFVCGVSIPVSLEDKKPWRSLGAVYGFQGEYPVPVTPIYWWNKWEGRSLAEVKMQYNKNGSYKPDESRIFIYALIEFYLNRAGKNGRQCLLRAICENALIDEFGGIIGEVISAVLKPSDDSDDEYQDAYKAGRYGAICTTMYPECPQGQGLFDGLTVTRSSNYYKDV
ncbi:unnamed protein product [Hermetia illucens]|uniref:Uncharacterized protein n=1 Tax=Hermetia illucens TaxID=343691 RepID=A0A7R8V3M2_HERIL|nr:uncharacterized protein LOC119657717 [Hermetia illucens]XP_037920689.1 uncharacterized protein LOC119657717 [Hermetia illucens]CAD7091045.1 unnamed protein product [Hermetia illucens]